VKAAIRSCRVAMRYRLARSLRNLVRGYGAAVAAQYSHIYNVDSRRSQPARAQWHLSQITDEIEPSERGRHVLGARRKSERRTRKLRYAKPNAPKPSCRPVNPPLRKSKADELRQDPRHLSPKMLDYSSSRLRWRSEWNSNSRYGFDFPRSGG
jgi:hypothetical protein